MHGYIEYLLQYIPDTFFNMSGPVHGSYYINIALNQHPVE